MAFKGPATFKGHAVVVGAGPAGCLSAMHLAKRGYRVDVFEKRSKEMLDPTVEKNGTRTYKMSLNSRSIHALENVGAKIPSFGPEAVPNMGAWMGGRPPAMGVSIIGDPYSTACFVERLSFGMEMIEETTRMFPGSAVNFHFGQGLVDLDLKSRTAKFGDNPKPSSEAKPEVMTSVQYDLLIGADGARSAVRNEMLKQVEGFQVKELYESPQMVKVTSGLPRETEGADKFVPGFLDHRWTESSLLDSISAAYPNVPATWAKMISEQAGAPDSDPATPGGAIIQCNQFHGPRVVLLGDAAHAVTPGLGQGCNAALESVQAFNSVLDKCADDLDKAPSMFSDVRVKDAHSLQEIELCFSLTLYAAPKGMSWMTVLMAKIKFIPALTFGMLAAKLLPFIFKAGFPLTAALRDRRWKYSHVLIVTLLPAFLLSCLTAYMATKFVA